MRCYDAGASEYHYDHCSLLKSLTACWDDPYPAFNNETSVSFSARIFARLLAQSLKYRSPFQVHYTGHVVMLFSISMDGMVLASVIFLAGLGRCAPPPDTSETKSYSGNTLGIRNNMQGTSKLLICTRGRG